MDYMSSSDKMATMSEQSITGKFTDGSSLVARSVSWWNEALHGIKRGCGVKCPTQFAEVVVMHTSSVFNPAPLIPACDDNL
jgi:hypothetical protein